MTESPWVAGVGARKVLFEGAGDSESGVPSRGEITKTMQHQTDHRVAARQPIVVIIGSGQALKGLANPRLITFGEKLDIGRRLPADDGRDVLVLRDRTVSGHHARIRWIPAASEPFVIEDLGSMNGTYVDGRRIGGPTFLRDGALLFLGSQALVFRLVTPVELAAVRHEAAEPLGPTPTSSPALALVTDKLRLLAPSNTEILLAGETGVGKEVFAQAIHAVSRRQGRFVAVNCAAIPAELVESELFGYERGAHSTARGRKSGFVEMANGGTLFLDEIGDMYIDLQSKLLRFVQDRRYTPLGSTRELEARVRIIAATSRAVAGQHAQIQEALLARLGAQPVTLPALRDRVEDIGRLAAYFLRALRPGMIEAPEAPAFEPDAFQALLLYAWPLNVRELSKVIGEAALLSRGQAIGIEHLPEAVTAALSSNAETVMPGTNANVGARSDDANAGHPAVDTDERAEFQAHHDTAPGTSAEMEKQRIVEALALTAGNQSRAAVLLGMSRRAFLLRLERYHIRRPQKGPGPSSD